MKNAMSYIENYLGDEVLERYNPKTDPIGIKYRAMHLADILDEAYGTENLFSGILDRPCVETALMVIDDIESIYANTYMLKKFKRVWESWNIAHCNMEKTAIAMYIAKMFTVSRDCMEPLLEKDPFLPKRIMHSNFPSEFGIAAIEPYPRRLKGNTVLSEFWDVSPDYLISHKGFVPQFVIFIANEMFGYGRQNDWLGRYGYKDVQDFIVKHKLDEEEKIGMFVTPW